MLSRNIKALRKSKGLSQEELAVKLNVVRQTVSKWETGLSVPDADMLISLSEALEIPVSVLLGETVEESRANDLKVISEKLEIINLQLASSRNAKKKRWTAIFCLLIALSVLVFIFLAVSGSPYLSWDYSDPERAVVGVALHAFEWIFIRLSPLVVTGAAVGIFLLWRKK